MLELVIAISIMAIVAGVALPLARKVISSKRASATVSELEGLQEAAAEYFQDTGALPSAIADMERDPGVTGWAGPYLQHFSIDQASGLSQYAVDAWSRAYSLSSAGSVLTITSAGPGGAQGDGDDLSCQLDVTSLRRTKTLATLGIVNRAISAYNQTWLGEDPLPASYSTALTKLVSRGYLATRAPYEVDGWGSAFVADPQGLSPVMRIGSTNLALSSGEGGAGEAGVGDDEEEDDHEDGADEDGDHDDDEDDADGDDEDEDDDDEDEDEDEEEEDGDHEDDDEDGDHDDDEDEDEDDDDHDD